MEWISIAGMLENYDVGVYCLTILGLVSDSKLSNLLARIAEYIINFLVAPWNLAWFYVFSDFETDIFS